jgi:hypothetical protein
MREPVTTPAVASAPLPEGVHQSRWGYHPCSYETFLLLRKCKKHYWKAVYAAARRERWARKLPENRRGPEPATCAVFGVYKTVYVLKSIKEGGEIVRVVPVPRAVLDDFGILEALARCHPAAEPAAVRKLNLAEADVRALAARFA